MLVVAVFFFLLFGLLPGYGQYADSFVNEPCFSTAFFLPLFQAVLGARLKQDNESALNCWLLLLLLPCRDLFNNDLTELLPGTFDSLAAITALYAKPLFFQLIVPFSSPVGKSSRQKCLVRLYFFLFGELASRLLAVEKKKSKF